MIYENLPFAELKRKEENEESEEVSSHSAAPNFSLPAHTYLFIQDTSRWQGHTQIHLKSEKSCEKWPAGNIGHLHNIRFTLLSIAVVAVLCWWKQIG